VHERVAQPMGGMTDGGQWPWSGGDAAPSGTDGEHGRPLAVPWARALEETS
jgi:hypothetical protein